jgi:energy-coupling factor transporter ATP-binding protein EcfA2
MIVIFPKYQNFLSISNTRPFHAKMATHLPPQISDLLTSQSQRLAILTCGLTGSGKSTLARSIVAQYPNFIRLSIDGSILETHGVIGKDYEPSLYPHYQDEARVTIKEEL